MKKQFLAMLLLAAFTSGAFAQQVTFDNGDNNTNASINATSNGLIFRRLSFTSFVPLDQDINLSLLGGSSANNLQLIATLSFANGLAQGDVTAIGIPGIFTDLTGTVYTIPGVPTGGTAFLEVEAWTGNAPSYIQAIEFGDLTAVSGIFQNPTAGHGPFPPTDLTGMPSFILENPEPSTLALCALGASSLLLFRRRKN